MENGLTPEQFLNIGEKMKKAQNDTTPFAIVSDDKISVSGDANKTEVKKNDYEIKFRMPKEMFDSIPAGAREIGDFYIFVVKYEGITITPRNDLKIMASALEVKQFFEKVKEDGSVEEMSKEELFSIFAYADDKILLAFYRLVGTFLGIDDKMGEYMLPGSVVDALNKIFDAHPEMINEADVFFG